MLIKLKYGGSLHTHMIEAKIKSLFSWSHTHVQVLAQLVIPDELPCFDLTQIRMRILQFYKGLFESIYLLFAWRAVCVEFISCSPLSN